MLTFKIESDGDQFHAFSPELPGCHTFGKTPHEAMLNLKEAMVLYIEEEMEHQGFQGWAEASKGHAHV